MKVCKGEKSYFEMYILQYIFFIYIVLKLLKQSYVNP